MSTRSSKRLISDVNSNKNHDSKDKKLKYRDENIENVIIEQQDSLSDYEKLRMANIEKNQQFLSSLGIDAVKPTETVIKRSNTTVRGAIKKKGLAKNELPTRRSGRVTIDKLTAEVKELEEKADNDDQLQLKKAELEALIAVKKTEGSYGSYEPNSAEFAEDSRARKTEDYISTFKPSNIDDDDDDENIGKEIITNLKAIQKKVQPKSKSDDYTRRISKLKVKENDFAKVTEARITSIWAHPSDQKVIVAAGDKTGCIGIWDVNANPEGLGGVYRYNPHASNVISLYSDFNDPSKLLSGSYDGTIRCLDLNKEAFSLVFEAEESIYDVMFKDVTFIGNKAYIATKGGEINFADMRVGNKKYQWSYDTLSEASLNSIQIHPTDDNYIITAGLRGITQVHDLRNASKKWKPLVRMEEHSKSVNAANVSPDGKYMVSVGLDDTIKIWCDFLKQNYPKPFVYRHDNHTGRWLSVFKPAFDPKHPHSFIVGSMERVRNVEIFSPIEKDKKTELTLVSKLSGGYLNSIVSRNCFHPTLDLLCCGNSSGKIYILR